MPKPKLLSLLLILALVLVSCTPAEKLIKAEYEAIWQSAAVFLHELYEKSYVSSGATGDCAGTSLVRWYGTELEPDRLTEQVESNVQSL